MRHESPTKNDQEGAFAGLPTREEINSAIKKIHAPFVLQNQDPQMEKTECKGTPALEFSPAEYEQYQKEFFEDVRDFGIRIQRLKIRTLSHYLAGFWDDPSAKTDKERVETAGRKIYALVSKLKHGEKKKMDPNALSLIQEKINHNLPDEYCLTIPFSPADINLVDEMAAQLLWHLPLSRQEKRDLEIILGDIREIETTVASLLLQEELFSQDSEGYVGERRMGKLWLVYRRLLKQIAGFEELDSWYSPTYQSTGGGQKGKKQRSIPFKTDYQRFQYDEVKKLESLLGHSYFRDQIEWEGGFVLFNGGLNALEGIYALINRGLFRPEKADSSQKKATKVFKSKNIFFEVDSSISVNFRNFGIIPEEFDGTDIDRLIQRTKADLPHVVFLSPLSNAFEMKITEITKLLDALADPEWEESARKRLRSEGAPTRDIYIVIDNSSAGRLAQWRNFPFHKLPEFVKVVGFESLIKYAQDGQELAQAGLVVAPGRFTAGDLSAIRGRIGSMPPQNTIQRLMAAVPADLTDKKMIRHSRNSLLLGENIEKEIRSVKSGLLGGVIYPMMPSYSQRDAAARELIAGGGLLNIRLDFDFLPGYQEIIGKSKLSFLGRMELYRDAPIQGTAIEDSAFRIASAFAKLVFTLAKKAGVALNGGTSFGFHATRMAIYNRDLLPDEENKGFREHSHLPYIRVATGTETNKDMVLIMEAISRANEVFAQAIKERCVITLSETILSRDYDSRLPASLD